MNVPEELSEYKLERAELAIALPADWRMEHEAFSDGKVVLACTPSERPCQTSH